MAITINNKQLQSILEKTPSHHNIMLVGVHGIGKSRIISEFFRAKGIEVITLFLGQMSDPGDLIGLPHLNTETGRTEFMPPYWFPKGDKPIVLFLDELNRARPEMLQSVMDLVLSLRSMTEPNTKLRSLTLHLYPDSMFISSAPPLRSGCFGQRHKS